MGGILGGGSKLNSNAVTKYTGINIQTSAQNIPITLVWGKKRIGDNLIWYNDFLAIPEKNGGKKGGGGGKGGALGGKGGGGVVYDYYAAVILALCEGPVTGIGQVWNNKDLTSLAALGLTLFTGTASQAPWAYVTGKHPTQARSYAYTAYLANSKFSLGKSPDLPNLGFEIITPLSGSMPGTVDVNMADVINDFLTNPQYSIGLSSSAIDSASWTNYKSYVQAQGLFTSPDITSQEQVSQVLDRWAQITNSWIFWSGSALKFIPLGDAALSANSATYTPNTTIEYNLSYEDFISNSGDLPVSVTRTDPADAPNHVRLEFTNRGNSYNSQPAEWKDQGLVDEFGLVDSSTTQAHEICDPTVGQIVAQLIGQRGAYLRNSYDFKAGWEIGSFLEPGDLVTLTEPHIGLNLSPVRITQLQEDSDGNWSITAEEYPGIIGTAIGTQQAQAVVNYLVDTEVSPGNVNPPAIVEPDSNLTGDAEVWIAASGGSDWGGCAVYISFDGTNFNSIGLITSPAPQGTLTGSLPSATGLDITHTLSIDTTISDVALPTDATTDDADNFRTLSLITPSFTTVIPGNGELLAYGASASTGTFTNDLTYLQRGLYGTTPGSFSSGAFFTRLDLNASIAPGNTTLIYSLPSQYIGQTIHLKFQSFNRFGKGVQDLSSVTVYTYVPTGTGFGTGTGGVPSVPAGFTSTATSRGIQLTWTPNPAADNVVLSKIYRATGTSQPFGSATQIGTSGGSSYTDVTATPGSAYTYFVVAENAVGDSGHTATLNATMPANSSGITFSGSETGALTAGQVLLDYAAAQTFSLPTNLTGSLGGISTAGGTAPTVSAVFTVYKNATSIGSMTIPTSATGGANSATFSCSATSFALGDHLRIVGPSPADVTLAGVFFSLLGTTP